MIDSFKSKFKITRRTKWEAIFVLALFSITILYQTYVKKTRERDETTTFGQIYQIENASKGYVIIKFYFLIQSGDTIKSSHHLFPRNTGDYYMNNRFIVEYSASNPNNNEILLDKTY